MTFVGKRSLRDSLRSGARPTCSTTSLKTRLDTRDDLLHVLALLLLGDVLIFGCDEIGCLLERVLDDVVKLLVLEHLVNVLLPHVAAVVRSGGVTGGTSLVTPNLPAPAAAELR